MNPSFKDLTYLRLKLPLKEFKERNPRLRMTSPGVTLPSYKMSKSPLDYVSYASESFKKNLEGLQLLQENTTNT